MTKELQLMKLVEAGKMTTYEAARKLGRTHQDQARRFWNLYLASKRKTN